MITNFGAFLGISVLLVVAPGPDTAITTRNALVGGRRAGLYTILGVSFGLAVWTLATGVGVAALLRASEPAFVALKLVGAVYLAVLGVRAIWGAVRRVGPLGAGHVQRRTIEPRVALRQGALTNLGNPKIAVFFTSFLPQFTSSGQPAFWSLLALGLIFCSMTLVWLVAYASGAARVAELLRQGRIRRTIDALSGVVLVGFGLRLAIDRS